LLSVFYEFLRASNSVYEHSLKGDASKGVKVFFIRFVSKFVISTLGYSIMLITMTFNYGLFFAVMFGLAIGHAAFSGWVRRAQGSKSDNKSDNGPVMNILRKRVLDVSLLVLHESFDRWKYDLEQKERKEDFLG
jgi:hypothetical protein